MDRHGVRTCSEKTSLRIYVAIQYLIAPLPVGGLRVQIYGGSDSISKTRDGRLQWWDG